MAVEHASITALLGPTNTGKTHRAIERMLEHASGMIGLPLRLLAREVYDKISAKVGEGAVALVTGEEQRVPPRPAYWVATVEAMPEREVDFVAIDEIQLATHDQRGHVFTSRVLGARGRKETWLLGAESMRGALRELVPTARAAEHPRLSRLSFAGAAPLAKVPPRSAIVAFSMQHVYEVAERLRARRGGTAVVTGALSPRTRNAQVAMFQAGEVDYLVATDAIGMGLNLDVAHVAFAATRKFDGAGVREVDEAELAQIAGRAGRWILDGTFGTVAPLELPHGVAQAIEAHRFAPVRRVRWRNDALDFTSVEALRASLAEAPRQRILVSIGEADDAGALRRLSPREGVAGVATGEERVRLLWDVCSVPDFKKLLFEAHVDFLEELWGELTRHGRVRDDWIAPRVRELDDTRGDVETLIARLAGVRTWTYVSNRASWLASPAEWQEQTRALEDRLSDALHERLVARFVDAQRGRVTRRARPRAAPPARSAPELELPDVQPGHPFAKLAAMRAALAPEAPRSSPRGPSWIDEAIEAAHEDLRLEGDGRIVLAESGRVLGAVVGGGSVALPDVRLVSDEAIGAGARARLSRRLVAFARDVVSELLGGARELARGEATAAMRALVHRLEQGLGTALAAEIADVCLTLTGEEREALGRAGIELGAGAAYARAGLGRAALSSRVALASAFFRCGARLAPPGGGAVSFVASRGVDPRAYLAIGYPVVGGRAVRADVLDRVLARIAERGADEAQVASWLGAPRREVRRILRELPVA